MSRKKVNQCFASRRRCCRLKAGKKSLSTSSGHVCCLFSLSMRISGKKRFQTPFKSRSIQIRVNRYLPEPFQKVCLREQHSDKWNLFCCSLLRRQNKNCCCSCDASAAETSTSDTSVSVAALKSDALGNRCQILLAVHHHHT